MENIKDYSSENISGALQHYRDVSSMDIFKNKRLSCQFLRNYINLSLFSDIEPDDIEDVTDHYKIYLGVKIEGDTIKKVRVYKNGQSQDIYVISIIEHKSYVDYDVSMQILHYMSAIWYEYAKEQDKIQAGVSKRKRFRYPLIIPVVYYEGKNPWTADTHLKARIEYSELLADYIPDYKYIVVPVHGYSNEELIQRGDEIAAIMMINKVQTAEDLTLFRENAMELVGIIFENAPEDVQKLMMDMFWTLLMRINVPVDEAVEILHSMEENDMGKLFANMDPIDIQKERAKTEAQRKLTEIERMKTEEQKRLTELERTRTEEQRKLTELERRRAEEERQRAEEERQRAEEEKQRAEEQSLRAQKAEKELAEARQLIEELTKKASSISDRVANKK